MQVVAILLLQCYPFAPYMGRKPAQPKCSGNHAQCGCSPERIASRTCCCFHRKPDCCGKEKGHDGAHVAGRAESPSLPSLSTAPCGGAPKFITASLDKLKFVRPETFLSTPSGCSSLFTYFLRETAPSRFMEPPDPPPKLTFLT